MMQLLNKSRATDSPCYKSSIYSLIIFIFSRTNLLDKGSPPNKFTKYKIVQRGRNTQEDPTNNSSVELRSSHVIRNFDVEG